MRRRAGPSDTTPEAQRVLDEAFRSMTPERKWRRMVEDFRFGRQLHEAGYRFRHPSATAGEVHRAFLRDRLGEGPWLETLRGTLAMQTPAEQMAVVREVIAALDRLGVAYAVGGSLASSQFGITRQTRDADLTVEPFPGREAELASLFGADYYLSVEAAREAVRRRSTFNIIHTGVGFKVDLFVRKDRPFDGSTMARRVFVTWPDDPDHPVAMLSPEDVILQKLEWYRLGGEVSDRQWLDVLEVLRIQAGRLDDSYLDHWAAELRVADLLAEARRDAAEGA